MKRMKRYHKAALTDAAGHPLHNGDVLMALGLRPGHRLPDEGTDIHTVGGLRVKVAPKGMGLSQRRRAHRTLAECPRCGDWFCAGHIYQHVAACKPEADEPPGFDSARVPEWTGFDSNEPDDGSYS